MTTFNHSNTTNHTHLAHTQHLARTQPTAHTLLKQQPAGEPGEPQP